MYTCMHFFQYVYIYSCGALTPVPASTTSGTTSGRVKANRDAFPFHDTATVMPPSALASI